MGAGGGEHVLFLSVFCQASQVRKAGEIRKWKAQIVNSLLFALSAPCERNIPTDAATSTKGTSTLTAPTIYFKLTHTLLRQPCGELNCVYTDSCKVKGLLAVNSLLLNIQSAFTAGSIKVYANRKISRDASQMCFFVFLRHYLMFWL